MDCIRGCRVTLGAFVLIFLHCGFLNVVSNCLHKRMQIRIGCIFFIFHHNVLSNVSLNGLHKRMYNCIGCICLVFQCIVALVTFVLLFTTSCFQMCHQSTCKRSCKVAFIWLFSTVCFQMCPQMCHM